MQRYEIGKRTYTHENTLKQWAYLGLATVGSPFALAGLKPLLACFFIIWLEVQLWSKANLKWKGKGGRGGRGTMFLIGLISVFPENYNFVSKSLHHTNTRIYTHTYTIPPQQPTCSHCVGMALYLPWWRIERSSSNPEGRLAFLLPPDLATVVFLPVCKGGGEDEWNVSAENHRILWYYWFMDGKHGLSIEDSWYFIDSILHLYLLHVLRSPLSEKV